MSQKTTITLAPSILTVVLLLLLGQSARSQDQSWIDRSNQNTQVALEALAKASPETASNFGVDGLDEEISDLSEGFLDRQIQGYQAALTELKRSLGDERDPLVHQDLEIVISALEQEIQRIELNRKNLIPYINPSEVVYNSLRALLDDRIPAERQKAALVRLKRYAGTEKGYRPLVDLAQAHMKEGFSNPQLIGPFKDKVERDLENMDTFSQEIGELFAKYQLKSYKKDYQVLLDQLDQHREFVEKEVLPKCRADFRDSEELYSFRLGAYGVDMPISELQRRAKVAFKELQDQLQALGRIIAEQRNFKSSDYRDVIRELKKEQLVGESILPVYNQRIKDLEEIIKREGILTLPDREMRIRLASPAESARSPAPFMSPPRLIGNSGEYGEFVLPLRLPGGGEDNPMMKVDDFTHESASWALAVHEGRPGHELQFASIVEKGVSQARVIFAFNSVNVEGWALYAEEEMMPFLPLEGQFFTLWSRMVRAARAFLDPGLNLGVITREEASRVLREEIVLSEALVLSEVQRYTFRAPGQATSYFCGYLRLMEMRTDTELQLGEQFNRQAYHDFILEQGLLPPVLLAEAVRKRFVAR